jgi:hypothetical protein
MTRLTNQVLWVASAIAINVLAAKVAEAQTETPRRGGRGFPVSAARLATAEEVEAALKLSDEQKQKVADINEELRADVGQAFQSGGGFDQIRKLNEEASAKLAEALDETQLKRLMGILVQVNGPGALVEPWVIAELKLSDEQKTKLADIRQAGWRSFGEAFQEMRDQNLSRDEMRAKFEELRDDTEQKLLAELTAEQKAQLDSLPGEPIEIDLTQFRGPGGGSGPDRRGQDDDRDQNGDSEDGESNKSEPAPTGN